MINNISRFCQALLYLEFLRFCNAALTAVLIDDNVDRVYDLDKSFSGTDRIRIRNRSTGMTYDEVTGKYYAISGLSTGSQILLQLAGTSKLPIAPISPSDVRLTCLTAGINGVFALDNNSLQFGKLNVQTGVFTGVSPIPGPFGNFVFAQDTSGQLHYINGNGRYFTSPSKKALSREPGSNFPRGIAGLCGDFDLEGENIIAGSLIGSGVASYAISERTAELITIDQDLIVQDVAVGPLSESSPSEKLTGISSIPGEDVVIINTLTSSNSPKIELLENRGITHDLKSGKFFAITGSTPGEQELVQVCANETISMAPVSPSAVQLRCMTSGPKGIYSLDIDAGIFGLININSGKFQVSGTIPGPFGGYVLAQSPDGNLHYINGDGVHYKRRFNKMKKTGKVFPTDVLGACGDFDGSDIVAGLVGQIEGVARYSFLKETATVSFNSRRTTFFNDVTTGSFNNECTPDDFSGASFFPSQNIVNVDLVRSRSSGVIDLQENLGITYDSANDKFYAISGFEAGSQTLVQVCSDTVSTIAPIIPFNSSMPRLSCLTSGPTGTFSIHIDTAQYGKLNVETGEWRKLGTLVGPFSSYAFAQDSAGTLHYINGDGKYFTNAAKRSELQHVTGTFFPTDNPSICGDFDGDDIVAAVQSAGGGSVRFNIAMKTATIQKLSPETFLNDIATKSISDDVVCPTTSPTSQPSASPSSKSLEDTANVVGEQDVNNLLFASNNTDV